MKILFAGTPSIAVASLEALAKESGVVAVLTGPDTTAGRGRKKVSPPVKVAAEGLGVPVLQPEKLDAAARAAVLAYEADLLVCFAYGKIFGPKFLELFPLGGINLHPSLLPRHRGPAPIPAAILTGDTCTGVTVQKISREMDAGDILLQKKRELNGTETSALLSDWAAGAGADALCCGVIMIRDGTDVWTPQDHSKATYTGLLSRDHGVIHWSEPAFMIERKIRAYTPWPGTVTKYGDKVLKILEGHVVSEGSHDGSGSVRDTGSECDGSESGRVPGTVRGVDRSCGILIETGDGLLAVTRLQIQNRQAMEWSSFMNGHPDFIGAVLGGQTV
jgi:methionyl-tRNA formyltransferase